MFTKQHQIVDVLKTNEKPMILHASEMLGNLVRVSVSRSTLLSKDDPLDVFGVQRSV